MAVLYHRRVPAAEVQSVLASGEVWGKAMRIVQGNGPACVKAFLGTLPSGVSGYTFETTVAPTRTRLFFGQPGAIWEDGSPGVLPVPGQPDFVKIPVVIHGYKL